MLEKHYADRLTAAVDKRLTVTEHRHRYLLLNAGHTAEHLYFIEKGIARCFYLDGHAGREVTPIIWKERSIDCDPVSFFRRKPSEMNIEVMPGSLLLS
ncbi:hypothetical protein [Gaoshiqia sp. Z1-71]|uniref:hypothetical protein n=1 Tax=Gaoshiqia hydrogeniformans TaxID=3290090 RepID=UPI003BF915F1